MEIVIAGGWLADLSAADMARLETIHSERVITEVVSRGAKGVGAAGERWGKSRGIPVKVFKADWARYRRGAGLIRNRQMAEYADAVAVFPGGSGT